MVSNPNSNPNQVVPIKGDVEEIERGPGRAEVIYLADISPPLYLALALALALALPLALALALALARSPWTRV